MKIEKPILKINKVFERVRIIPNAYAYKERIPNINILYFNILLL